MMRPDFFRSYQGAQVAMATIAQVQILALAAEAALLNSLSPLRGCVFSLSFSFSAVTGRWAWLLRVAHVTRTRSNEQPQISLTWGHHAPTAESLVSVSWFTLHSFTSCVYYLFWATWRLDKWINRVCWYTHLNTVCVLGAGVKSGSCRGCLTLRHYNRGK